MHPSANAEYGSSEGINISTEATTINTSPSAFLLKYLFDIILKEIFDMSDIISKKYDEMFEENKKKYNIINLSTAPK